MIIKNLFKNLGLVACLSTATMLVACGDDPAPSKCASGEIEATFKGESGCFKTCATTADCGTTETCNSSGNVCVPRASTTTDMGADMPVTPADMGADMPVTPADMGMDMPVTPTDMGMDMPVTDPDEALCMTYCDKLFGSCVTSQCGAALQADTKTALDNQYMLCLNGGTVNGMAVQACKDSIKASADNRTNVTSVANQVTCAQVKTGLYCDSEGLDLGDECSCPLPPVLGNECTTDAGCDGGSLMGVCTTDDPAVPGICLATGCSLPANAMTNTVYFGGDCGAVNEGACVPPQANATVGFCIETCQADADCAQSPATGCAPLGMLQDGTTVGTCEDKCAADADCVAEDANGNPLQGTCNADSFCDFQ
jgi:hypothetical protein